MADPIKIFRKTTGLNTLIDPVDLNRSEGIQELSIALDLEISDKGRLSRRKGYSFGAAGSYHSLFCDGGDAICVRSDGQLCVIDGIDTTTDPYSLSLLPIASVDPTAKLRAVDVNGRIYWVNGKAIGYIESRVNHNWTMGRYVGPTTEKALTGPPIGSLIEYFNGRMYIAQGKALWISEPTNFGTFDLSRGIIPFSSEITMIRAVDNGLFVSTGKQVFFLSGPGPRKFERVIVASYPAIKGTDAKFFGEPVFYPDGGLAILKNGQQAAMWLTEKGICAGFSGGKMINLTNTKIKELPGGISGSGIVFNGKYIGLIDP